MAHSAVFTRRGACASSHRISSLFLHSVVVIFLLARAAHANIQQLYVDTNDLQLLVEETHLFKLIQIGETNITLTVNSQIQHADIVQFMPPRIEIPGSENPNSTAELTHDICAYGKSPGHSEVTFNVTPTGYIDMDNVFIRVTVMHSHAIKTISFIMGWIYFAAWSVSFYPQIYTNFKRKSVVGLNFDFLAFNIFGFTMYSLFNCGLYFSKAIQAEYFAIHPRSLNPVQLNDVFFSLHAAFASLITIIQCFVFERDNQRVSLVGRGLLGVFFLVVLVTASMAAASQLAWLSFLQYCSYIKLCITLIKYVPQAYMNYKRKSTVGWSIGNIFLDFIGGFLSIFQMMLNAYNYDDWISFFGDATKFGLGAFSLIFDIFFILQHYVFYRYDTDSIVSDSNSSDEELSTMINSRSTMLKRSRSVDGRDYFLVVEDWHADEKNYDLNGKA